MRIRDIFSKSVRIELMSLYLAIAICFMIAGCSGPATDTSWEDVEAGFSDPSPEARPRVWWHWMNGNVAKEGIRSDFEWLYGIGVRGFQNFDAGLNTPQIVEKRLIYMTPEWKDAFLFTTRLADSMGLEMAIAGSPGWSESGGPWVTPGQAMKKYVWSETEVEGGKLFSSMLPRPSSATGAFQNIQSDQRSYNLRLMDSIPEYYSDAAVIAFRLPESDLSLSLLQPVVTSSGGEFILEPLIDGDLVQSQLLPAAPEGSKSWIQFDFEEPRTIRAITLVTGTRAGGFPGDATVQTLEASDDGESYSIVAEIPSGNAPQNTITFPPATAKSFRFCIMTTSSQVEQMGGMFRFEEGQVLVPEGTYITELVLHTGTRVNRFEEKAAFVTATGLNSLPTPEASPEDVISTEDVIDLTSEMAPDGTISWTPPEGRWIIMRLGYSLTGHQNGPASPEATGLEVDKLNPEHVKAYFDDYLGQYEDATGGLMGEHGLQYIITDSWEAGAANWTDNMIKEFNVRNGYDMIPWLPVLSGHVVGSADASDRFLWDFRLTLGKMVAEYHYDGLTKILHDRGMGRYTESHENGRAFIGDGMEIKRTADVPMSATWVTRTPSQIRSGQVEGVMIRHQADVRESASVAHIYGQNLVAAESMTAAVDPWGHSPESLKPTADMEMASGLNRFVIHTSVHQPADDKIPGLSLGPFGQWFTRHETWAGQAEPWISYMSRSCHMLQQGTFVADIAYLYGEDCNVTALFGRKLPDIPEGYEFDFVNADALLNVLSVKSGDIVTPSGMRYRLLALDKSTEYMSLPVLKKISKMVKAGAVIVGSRPTATPSLNDDDEEFMELAEELWGEGTGMHTVGKGGIYTGMTMTEVLEELEVIPDMEYTKMLDDTKLLYVHRTLPVGDIYWINNRNHRFEDLEATFRVTGKSAEIWDPVTGVIKEASYSISNGRTTVPLSLEPDDALFVVFRKDTEEKSRVVARGAEKSVATPDGPWMVAFQPDRGAPDEVTMDKLTPWNENNDDGIKYFSGTGTYSISFRVEDEWLSEGKKLMIDLGDVKNIAEVSINGEPAGIVWKRPFRVDVTGKVKQGDNNLEVKVINLWVNRIIGDLQPGVTEPVTYTTQHTYQPDSPLLPSGLMGPVEIISVTSE